MCEIYHCTPRQWREEFSYYEQQAFLQIQNMKATKRAQDGEAQQKEQERHA